MFFITDRPIGSIIAITVCSPRKDDRIAEIVISPAKNILLLFPKILIISFANRISSP